MEAPREISGLLVVQPVVKKLPQRMELVPLILSKVLQLSSRPDSVKPYEIAFPERSTGYIPKLPSKGEGYKTDWLKASRYQ